MNAIIGVNENALYKFFNFIHNHFYVTFIKH